MRISLHLTSSTVHRSLCTPFRWNRISGGHVLAGGQCASTIAAVRPESTTSFRQQFKQDKKAQKALKRGESVHGPAESPWQLVVGIEIHAELNTERKLFSTALTTSDQPNTSVALHDLAYPGAQPVFQIATVVPAIRAALALACDVKRKSSFDRKHYFYQDQPAGYQITQFYEPFARDGQIVLRPVDGISPHDGEEVLVRIERVQLEQDTAKSLVTGSDTTLLDFNRVSHPLVEIISKPDIHSPATAAAYVRKVQAILKSVGAVTAGMEVGGLRADVNVSVRKMPENGEQVPLGQRTEIKNLSSFKAIEDAVTAERNRQILLLERGGRVAGETRGWTLGGRETHKLRGKEGEVDYRYMPDPDIPPLIISSELVAHLKDTLPRDPESIIAKLISQGLTAKDARTLAQWDDGERLEYFAYVVEEAQRYPVPRAEGAEPGFVRATSNFLIHEIPALIKKSDGIEWSPSLVPADQLAQLVAFLLGGQIHMSGAKTILADIFWNIEGARHRPVMDIIEQHGFKKAETDELSGTTKLDEFIGPVARRVFEANPKMVQDILRKNEVKKLNFFVSLVRRELAGQQNFAASNPREVHEAVHKAFWETYKRPVEEEL